MKLTKVSSLISDENKIALKEGIEQLDSLPLSLNSESARWVENFILELEVRIRNLGRTRGWARFRRVNRNPCIELHEFLFLPGNEEKMQTVLMHEIAHHIDYIMFSGRGHGRQR